MRASRFLTIALPTEIGLFARCRFPAGDLLRLSLGDYITAVADTSQVYVVWTDTPNSRSLLTVYGVRASFASQCDERIDPRRTASRNEGGSQPRRGEYCQDCGIHGRFMRLNLEEKPFHQLREAPCACPTNGQSNGHVRRGAPENGREDRGGARPQGHAHADLVGPLTYRVSHDAINPHTSDHETQDPEQREQQHVETSLRHETVVVVVERVLYDM